MMGEGWEWRKGIRGIGREEGKGGGGGDEGKEIGREGGRCSDAIVMYVHTISNRILTSFSDSPRYLEERVDAETLKKVVPHSVATALARSVFPVPGGPTINTPYVCAMRAVLCCM